VPLFDTNTYAEVVVNVDHVVRIVQAPGATLVQAVLVDGSFVEVSAGSRDHDRLLEAIGHEPEAVPS
jgi:hypothetical protein